MPLTLWENQLQAATVSDPAVALVVGGSLKTAAMKPMCNIKT